MYEFRLLVFISTTVDGLCIFFLKMVWACLNLHPFAVLVLELRQSARTVVCVKNTACRPKMGHKSECGMIWNSLVIKQKLCRRYSTQASERASCFATFSAVFFCV